MPAWPRPSRRARPRLWWACLLAGALLHGCADPVAPRLSAIQERIFTPTCTFSSCHSVDGHAGELVLVSGRSLAQLVNAPASQDAAAAASLVRVVPGQPDQSFLVLKLRPHLPASFGKQMPDGQGLLDDDQRGAIEEWIRRGANDD